ncbi:MAG: TetR/AcrR family transcriptional regulator [Deltaproteobacteria bacterium]|nr:TetR/AcrR family transcriptional regulator [Deltaproteobacteria bacterium]
MPDFTKRQKDIIDVSIKIIAKKGIQHLTIKNISKSLGISEPAIYRHFESKLDILLAILLNFKIKMRNSIDHIQALGKSPVEQIEVMLFSHFKEFVNNPALAAVIFSEEIFQNDKRLAREVKSIMKLSQDFITSLIQEGQQSHMIRDDIPQEQLSLIILGALRLIVTRWQLSDTAFDLEKEGQNLWMSIKKLIYPVNSNIS